MCLLTLVVLPLSNRRENMEPPIIIATIKQENTNPNGVASEKKKNPHTFYLVDILDTRRIRTKMHCTAVLTVRQYRSPQEDECVHAALDGTLHKTQK